MTAPTLADLIERAEDESRRAKRAAAHARQKAEANPNDIDARFDRQEAEEAATAAGRRLAELRWEQAYDGLQRELQALTVPTALAVELGYVTAEERAAALAALTRHDEETFGRELLALAPVGPYGHDGFTCRDSSWMIAAKLKRDGMTPPAGWRSDSGQPLPAVETRASR